MMNEQWILNIENDEVYEEGIVTQWSHLNTGYINSYNNLYNSIKFEYNDKWNYQQCGMGSWSMRCDDI